MARVDAIEEWQGKADDRLRLVEKLTPTPDEKRDLELRIRALEAVKWKHAGAIAVLVFVCTIAGAVIARKLGT